MTREWLLGLWRSLSILLGMIAGYALAMYLGLVDVNAIGRAPWHSLSSLSSRGRRRRFLR